MKSIEELHIECFREGNLALSDFQKTGNILDGLFRDISKLFLNFLEEGDQIPFLTFKSREYVKVIFMGHELLSV